MKTLSISLTVQQAQGLRDFIDPMTGKRRVGMVYYQQLSDGGFIPRCLSELTDKDNLLNMIRAERIYIHSSLTIAEPS
jgi:hypothetical protein